MNEAVAVDASALVCMFNLEAEAAAIAHVFLTTPAIIGAPTLLEVRIWCLRRLGRTSDPMLDTWLKKPSTRIVPFDADLEGLAASAYDRFGKGRHPAALNFGDVMTYAVARRYDAPLLFKGGDFGKTDVRVHEASVSFV